MKQVLQDAFRDAARLPDDEQDALARWILEELADERHWSEQFAASEDQLAHLADEALLEHQAGKTQTLDRDYN